MKSLVIFGCFIAIAVAQRPSFAGTSAKGLPELASRFQDTSSNSAASTSNSIANRVGEANDVPRSTEKLPVDARGDADLVNKLNQWPRENRPYWLLNAEQIEKHRNPEPKPEGKQKKQYN